MNLNLATADRDVYNILDFIGDVGGLERGLRTIITLVMMLLTYKSIETYMVTQLFQVKTDSTKEK